jgi:hypothetical protein
VLCRGDHIRVKALVQQQNFQIRSPQKGTKSSK